MVTPISRSQPPNLAAAQCVLCSPHVALAYAGDGPGMAQEMVSRTDLSPPEFARGVPLLEDAYRFALAAHHGPENEGDTEIEHPQEVARLLHECGFSEEVVAAALLHDVVEDTGVDLEEISLGFGPEIQSLVAEMTEDEGIEPYEARKAEHRRRIVRDRRVAAIYAADKVANTRDIRAGQSSADPDRLEHFRETLRLLCETHQDLPFLGVLREELNALADG